MHILVTNDDGIGSPALAALAAWATRLGTVTVIAPEVEQSGKSHAIDFQHRLKIERVTLPACPDVPAWSVGSTPADCVRYGTLGLKETYDLVLSGPNRGYNLGGDIVYSGTVGAIYEAARQGVRGMALSTKGADFETAIGAMDRLWDYIQARDLFSHARLYNVNFPPECGDFCITRLGGIYYTDEFVHEGHSEYQQYGSLVHYDERHPEHDLSAVASGRISVTPLATERTNISAFQALLAGEKRA